METTDFRKAILYMLFTIEKISRQKVVKDSNFVLQLLD